jgi:type VI secretion system protein
LFIRLALSVAAVAVLSFCGVTGKVRSAFGGHVPIEVTIDPRANEDSPVAVDLVVVYDAKLVDSLLKMPASEWFSKKRQYLADHGSDVEVQGWEWVPGQTIDPFKVTYRSGADHLVLFADYHTEGDHRAAVRPPRPFRLRLGERDFSVEVIQ